MKATNKGLRKRIRDMGTSVYNRVVTESPSKERQIGQKRSQSSEKRKGGGARDGKSMCKGPVTGKELEKNLPFTLGHTFDSTDPLHHSPYHQ